MLADYLIDIRALLHLALLFCGALRGGASVVFSVSSTDVSSDVTAVTDKNDTAVRSSPFRRVAEVHWSATPSGRNACYLYFDNDGYVYPSRSNYRASGCSVRCIQSAD